MTSPTKLEFSSSSTRDIDRADEYVPVLVVGAGPCGLTLANLLGLYGTGALLVERNQSTVSEPRAVSIDDESLRTMQAIELSEGVLRSIVPGYGSDYLTPRGRLFLSVEPSGRPFGFARRNAFRQPELEAQLRTGIARYPSLQTLYGWTLSGFQQEDDGVSVQLTNDQAEKKTVRCGYLIGCDGAGSTVRRELGWRLEGKTFEERWLIIDLAKSPAERRNTVVFCDAERPCIALPGPDLTRRFEFKLHPHERNEDMLRPEVVERLLSKHGAHSDSVLVRKVVYTFHARVAPQWSAGRVLLAGDAAHLTPPFAGQGMNSGLRDSFNLAWKLSLVTAGRASHLLLATYEEERRNHVWQMIRLALRMGRIMGPKTRLHGFLVQRTFMAIGLWPAAKRFFGEMKYKPKPKFEAGFMYPDGFGKRRTLVGRMLPQPMVVTSDGASVLLDRILGKGFALVGIQVAAAAVANAAATPELVELAPACVVIRSFVDPGTPSVQVAGLEAPHLDFDRYRGRILLVRPDRYVAASGTSSGPDGIGAAISRLFQRFSTSQRQSSGAA
jgi:3-(3-hydroxy-phenyl)propionate hydroxylase